MTMENAKNIIIKLVKTFIQAFLGCVMGYGLIEPENEAGYKALVVAGIAAGLSALMNVDYKALEGAKEHIKDIDNNDNEDEVEGVG